MATEVCDHAPSVGVPERLTGVVMPAFPFGVTRTPAFQSFLALRYRCLRDSGAVAPSAVTCQRNLHVVNRSHSPVKGRQYEHKGYSHGADLKSRFR